MLFGTGIRDAAKQISSSSFRLGAFLQASPILTSTETPRCTNAPGMARARCVIDIAQPEGLVDFEHTYYCFAPAFFLSRPPTQEEKDAFADQVAARYTPRAVKSRKFRCVVCSRKARRFVEYLTYFLSDPGFLCVGNEVAPVCLVACCTRMVRAELEHVQRTVANDTGEKNYGPERLGCRACFREFSDTLPMKQCSRCTATLYCSSECQKLNWRSHKQQCKGRVEAAKLTADQLAQLDKMASLTTNGTLELSHLDHPGRLPKNSFQHMFGGNFESGQEAAASRKKEEREHAKITKAAGFTGAVQLPLTTEQQLEVTGLRTDILSYFGMQATHK